MKRIFGIIIIGISIIWIIYFVEFEDTKKFLDITDYNIIQEKDRSLFLSITALDEIPEFNTDYGYGWLSQDSGKLSGYITNIHSDSQWHTELITINDTNQFCFDDVTLVNSNVVINENIINVIIENSDSINFDKIISYDIIKDDNCHLGYAGKIIDQYKVN